MSRCLGLVFSALLLIACNGTNATIGGACVDDRDCREECVESYPGGFCTVGCRDHGDCPGDAVCIDTKGGVCLFECESSAECRDRLDDNRYKCDDKEDFRGDRWDVCVPD